MRVFLAISFLFIKAGWVAITAKSELLKAPITINGGTQLPFSLATLRWRNLNVTNELGSI